MEIKYRVLVQTSDSDNASTDAKVYLIVGGENGESKEHRLNTPEDDWKKGQQQVFVFSSDKDLGRLTHIRLRHDNSHENPSWHVSFIMVQDPRTLACWFFPVHAWLKEGGRLGIREKFEASKLRDNVTVDDDSDVFLQWLEEVGH